MYRYVSFLNTADFPTSEKEKNIKSLYKVYINEDGKTIAHPCTLKDKKTLFIDLIRMCGKILDFTTRLF